MTFPEIMLCVYPATLLLAVYCWDTGLELLVP
jgi:hypothetical protein